MPRTLSLSSHVHAVDLSTYKKYVEWHSDHKYFLMDAGENHHKLLAYLASQLENGEVVYDLGTCHGHSALALASNENIQVVTFDIVECIPNEQLLTYKQVKNIKSIIADCKAYLETMRDASLILLDISPHDGGTEREIILELIRIGYKGLVVCDDIHLSQEMESFWSWVELKKYDVTHYGHWSGTGIIIFDPSHIDLLIV